MKRARWGRSGSPRGGLRWRATVIATTGMALFAACAESPSAPSAPTPLEALPRELSVAEQAVIRAGNDFAFDLFRASDREFGAENIFLSPLSAAMALGMTMNGARGETLAEMREVLGFNGMELQAINESYRDLMALLLGLDPSVDTRIANSIWYRQDFPFDQPFFDTAEEYFSAEVRGLPMVDADREVINGWVREATEEKITSIVDEIRPDHVMFLLNALYFKGDWRQQFDPSVTRDSPFQLANGGTVAVKTMHGSVPFGHRRMEGYAVVELPYGNGSFAMTILVPDDPAGVDALAAGLDAAAWEAATADLPVREMELWLPRFRIEYEQELNGVLQALGMRAAFANADFSGMSSSHGRSLVIDRVVQKTYVDVNEEGTEAAAVTSVGIVQTSLPPAVRVDRPFVFAIRERLSGAILFIGKVVDPS